jgi:LysR family glycine cleavage system transcriptional activator
MTGLPPLGSLQTIEVLSRRLRINAAATELGLSQAAVSQTITRMEKRLGVRLFVKTRAGVEPTPACQTLVEAYQSVSATLTRALAAASDAARFNVVAPPLVWSWFSPAILRLHRVCPNLSFQARQSDESVGPGDADFAIVPLGPLPPTGFDGAPLYDERLIPVCTAEYARSAKLETPAALARARLLLGRRDLWRSWFADAGLAVEPDLEGPVIADPALAMQAAAQGQGVALCCTVAASAAIARGELVAPIALSVSAERRIWAIWRKDSNQAPAMQVFDSLMSELTRLNQCADERAAPPRWRPAAFCPEYRPGPDAGQPSRLELQSS